MKSFTDCKGRSWDMSVTVATLRRVRSLTGIDLMEAVSGEIIDRMVADPVLLVDVLYAACKPQADASGVTDEEFGGSMAGDVIEHATAALVEALIDFFPNARDRETLGKVYQAAFKVRDRARDLVEAKIQSGALDKATEQILASCGDSSSSSPAPLGLTRQD